MTVQTKSKTRYSEYNLSRQDIKISLDRFYNSLKTNIKSEERTQQRQKVLSLAEQ